MKPIYLDPAHPAFPPEPALPAEALAARRGELTRWLLARLEELTGDCVIGEAQLEAGIVEASFPAMEGDALARRLAEEGVFCVPVEKGVRFTLSAGQAFEPIDTLQAVLMEVLDIQ